MDNLHNVENMNMQVNRIWVNIDKSTFLQEKMAERNKKLSLKPAQIDFEPRNKMKGKGGTAKKSHIKRTVKEEERRVSF